MTKKNENVQINVQEMQQFVEENINVVPKNRKNVFATWDLEKQYKEIKRWIEIAAWREAMIEKNKIENRVKELFVRRHVTVDDVLNVIEFCKGWIKEEREQEITRINEEIEKLNERKKQMEEA